LVLTSGLAFTLTNSLENGEETEIVCHWVAEDHAASEIKRDKKIMVVLGNPHIYFIANREMDQNLIEDSKGIVSEKKLNLDMLFHQIHSFFQWRLEQTGLRFGSSPIHLFGPAFRHPSDA